MAKFSIAATGVSPWFQILGRGKLFLGADGTWTGTTLIETKDPNGDTRSLNYRGALASYTANQGALELEDYHLPVRFNFTKTTGTLTPFAFSDESQIYFPDALGPGGLTFAQLPVADPHVVNQLWSSTGVVTVSAG